MISKDFSKKTVLVLGAGKTGIASAFFLLNKANKVLLSESTDEKEEITHKINELKTQGVKVEFKKNSEDFAKKADLVVISPGISPQTEIVKKINSMGIPIISDIELASYFINKPIIAVTGTNGKTTTTTLITHLINNSGKKAVSCGNIGKPLIEIATENKNNVDYYVLEISSFQIFYSPTFSPEIAVCLNVTPDHLDWHGSMNHYIDSKRKLFLQQKRNSWAILNYSDQIINNFQTKNNKFYFAYSLPHNISINSFSHLCYFEDDFLKVKQREKINNIINKNQLKILGSHNIENSLASIAVAKILSLKTSEITKSLSTFEGVEHRLEFVRKVGNKMFYNDSKATNPQATIKAIYALGERKDKKITLILGGRDKKTKLDEMTEAIKQHVCNVILFGEAKERFLAELNSKSFKELKIVKDLPEAVKTSLQSKGEIVLFSPACSSFDMFKNYEERGNVFKELVGKF